MNIGNDRLYQAVRALATMEGDVRSRVATALEIISAIRPQEFSTHPHIWERIQNLLKNGSAKGPLTINGVVLKSPFEHTASKSQNRTYRRHADEIFNIWLLSVAI
jgi:hypothetical protein